MTLLNALGLYGCPLAGCIVSCLLYSSPVHDLRAALRHGSLQELNPMPFAFALANTYGWIAYGFFHDNVALAAATIPGFVIALYLNAGAIKLQYCIRHKKRWERATKWHSIDMSTGTYSTASEDSLEYSSFMKNETVEKYVFENDFDSMVPQEVLLLKLVSIWIIVCVYAGFFADPKRGSAVVGWTVNLIMLSFYASPLETVRYVISSQDSAVIHRPLMFMSFSNAFFWVLYGLTCNDPIIYGPNSLGCVLTVAQMIVCCMVPSRKSRRIWEKEPLLSAHSTTYTIPTEAPVIVV